MLLTFYENFVIIITDFDFEEFFILTSNKSPSYPNAAVNGVFLPYKRNEYVTTESMHTGNHLRSYYNIIENRFSKIDEKINDENLSYSEARTCISKELQDIRTAIMNGEIITNNSKK